MNEDENILMNEFNSSLGLQKQSFLEKNKRVIIAGILAILFMIIIIIIIVLVSSKSSTSSQEEKGNEEEIPKRDTDPFGEIKCIYQIHNLNTVLLGKEFLKSFDFEMVK